MPKIIRKHNYGFVHYRPIPQVGALYYYSSGEGLDGRISLTAQVYDNTRWGGSVKTLSDGYYTVPAGVQFVRVIYNGVNSLNLRITRPTITVNDSFDSFVLPSCRRFSTVPNAIAPRVNISTPPIAVSAGDVISVINNNSTDLPDFETWFAIEALPNDVKYAVRTTSGSNIIDTTAPSWDVVEVDTGGFTDFTPDGTYVARMYKPPAEIARVQLRSYIKLYGGTGALSAYPRRESYIRQGLLTNGLFFVSAVGGSMCSSYDYGDNPDLSTTSQLGTAHQFNGSMHIPPADPAEGQAGGDRFDVQIFAQSNTLGGEFDPVGSWFAIEEVPEYDNVFVGTNGQSITATLATTLLFPILSGYATMPNLSGTAFANGIITVPEGYTQAKMIFNVRAGTNGSNVTVRIRGEKNGNTAPGLPSCTEAQLSSGFTLGMSGEGAWIDVVPGDQLTLRAFSTFSASIFRGSNLQVLFR